MIKNHNLLNALKTLLKLAIVFLFAIVLDTSAKGQTTVVLRQTPGEQTFTVPAGVTQITVEAWGGGGAAGGASEGRGGGGAGGAYVRSILTVTPNTPYDLYVAPSKASTVASSASANQGYSSWFDNQSRLVAKGGDGGGPASNNNGGNGIGSIIGSIGEAIFKGGNGTTGSNGGSGGGGAGSTGNGGNGTSSSGGTGGSQLGGNGGNPTNNNKPGNDGANYGGGGSGAHSNNSSQKHPGGEGAQGMIRITYTINNQLTATATTFPSCQGINPGTGTITVTASGGSSPYQYRLGSGSYQASNVFAGIQSGIYIVSVRDNAGSIFTINNVVVESEFSTLTPLAASITDANCNQANGAITITNIPTPLQFNKANSTHVDLETTLLNNLSQFTLEGWIKIDKSLITGDRTWGLFGQNDAIELGIMNSATLQLWTANGGSVNIPMSNYPDDNQWHHIAGVGTGTNLIVYIDGVVVTGTGTSVSTSNYGSSTFNSMIGGNIWDATGNYLDGSILKTGFWNRALSVSEILSIVNNPFVEYSSSQNGLIVGYNYFEGAGNTLSSVGLSSVNGTLVNSPVWNEVFTYSWAKTSDPLYTASTKNITAISAGDYTLTASFPGICPVVGTWTVNSLGINLWTGNTSTDWNHNSNWTCAIPDLTNDAIIPSGLSRYPFLSSGAIGAARNLIIETGASLTVVSNTLQIGAAIQNSGVLDVSQGTIEMRGNAAQVIPADCFSNNTIKNLTINNSNDVTLNGTLTITGVLSALSGTFHTSDFLTLASTATQTALIDGNGSGEVIGMTSIERFIPSAFGYKYFSSPFTGALVSEFSDDVDLNASFPAFYTYIENQATTGWVKYVNPEALLETGKGYAVNLGISTPPKTVTTTGQVTNGTVGPIVLHNHNEFYTIGFNLIGNPYPSPIDWNSSGITKQNIDDALYFFDAGNTDPYVGTYSTYINGISSNGGQANNIIAAQQGFFIHVTDGSYPVEGSITFTNAARVNNLNPVFHKNSVEQPESLIRLSAGFENSSVNDHMVVYFSNDARTEFDAAYDALKIMNTDTGVPNIYAITDDSRELSINALPYPTAGTYVVNLALTAKAKGTVIFKASEILNIPSGYKVYLKDAFTGRIQNLQSSPEYRFEINNESYTDRFKLIFSTETIAQEAFGTASYNAYTKDGNVYLNLKLSEEQVAVSVCDLTGRILLQTNIYGEGHHRIGKLTGAGVYIVSIYTDMGILSKKVYLN